MLQSPKEIHNLLSYFGRFEFLLVLQLLILQVLHFVLENPQLSDQALKTECVQSLSRFEHSDRCSECVCKFLSAKTLIRRNIKSNALVEAAWRRRTEETGVLSVFSLLFFFFGECSFHLRLKPED